MPLGSGLRIILIVVGGFTFTLRSLAQNTTTYTYVSQPFNCSPGLSPFTAPPLVGTCVGGALTATVTFSNLPSGYTGYAGNTPPFGGAPYDTGSLVPIASFSVAAAGFSITSATTQRVNITSNFLFVDGSIFNWTLYCQTIDSLEIDTGGISGSDTQDEFISVPTSTYGGINGSPTSTNGVITLPGIWTLTYSSLPILEITTTTLPQAPSGQPYSVTLAASGGTGTGLVWSVGSVALPAGFTLTPSGLLSSSGTPAVAVQSYPFSVKVVDSGNDTAIKTLTLVVPGIQITPATLSRATSGQPYDVTLTATGGTGTGYTWSLASGTLPPGFTLSSGGVLSSAGSPAAAVQTYSFTVKVTDSASNSATQVLTLVVQGGIQITPTTLSKATSGQPYSATFTATGGSGTGYVWSLSAGSLPSGFTFTPTGVLNSTGSPPAAVQTYTFTVKVTDSGGNSATQPLTLVIQSDLQITTTTLPNAISGQPYSVTLMATGGSGTGYTWSVSSGSLPDGFALTPSGLLSSAGSALAAARVRDAPSGFRLTAGGVRSMSASPGQTYTFTVKVTDSASDSATQPLTLVVQSDLQIITTTLPEATSGQPYSTTLAATGGSGTGYRWSVSSGSLPDDFILTLEGVLSSAGSQSSAARGGVRRLILTPGSRRLASSTSGSPAEAQTYAFAVTVTDSESDSATQPLTLVVQSDDLQITTTTLPNATNGQSYSATLMSAGGQGLITWTVTSGTLLPTGFLLSSSGELSSTGSPSAPPYAAYAVSITATDSVGTTAQKEFTLNVQLSSGFCLPPGSAISDVLLPPVTIQSALPKPWQISYGSIGLNFLTDISGDLSVACEAQASANLPVFFDSVMSFNLISQAAVVLSVFNPGTAGISQACSFSFFGGINNQCILDGSYDPNAYYMRWYTPGFSLSAVTQSGNINTPLGTGPLTFLVNLDNVGFSSGSESMDAVLRIVEPYVHTTLIDDLPELPGAVYTIIQDPGSVNLTVVNSGGLTAGVLPNGNLTYDIPLSAVYSSATNPAVILGNLGLGTYTVILTATAPGTYQLAVSSLVGVNAGPEQTVSGSLSQGESVAYRITISSSVGTGVTTQNMSPVNIVPGDLNGDGIVNCLDLAIVEAGFGKKSGQAGFNAWADVNNDGVINLLDLAFVSQRVQAGTVCP
jgi:hypothetical protein